MLAPNGGTKKVPIVQEENCAEPKWGREPAMVGEYCGTIPKYRDTMSRGGEWAELARVGEGRCAEVVGAHRECAQKRWMRGECSCLIINGSRKMLTRRGWTSWLVSQR